MQSFILSNAIHKLINGFGKEKSMDSLHDLEVIASELIDAVNPLTDELLEDNHLCKNDKVLQVLSNTILYQIKKILGRKQNFLGN